MRHVIAAVLVTAGAVASGAASGTALGTALNTAFGAAFGTVLSNALSTSSNAALVENLTLSAAIAVGALFAALGASGWRKECAQRVLALRLMGGASVLLYFAKQTGPVLTRRSGLLPRPAPPACAATFPYDGHPAFAVTVTRVLYWPGCLIGLTLDSVLRPESSLERLDGIARITPKILPPRHVVIFADTMSSQQFRSLAISLNCLQRGVTFVEHR